MNFVRDVLNFKNLQVRLEMLRRDFQEEIYSCFAPVLWVLHFSIGQDQQL